MLDAIRSARRRIDLETYVYSKGDISDRFTDALEAAARRGVSVTVIVDAIGSDRMPGEAWNRLKSAGAHLGDYGTPTWYKLQQPCRPNAARRATSSAIWPHRRS
jgi:cardiolipin synthase